MFSKQLAEEVKTGTGKPVTKFIQECKMKNAPFSVFDAPGFQLNNRRIQKDIISFIKKRNGNVDPSKHIHVVWYCVSAQSKRIEDEETAFIKQLRRIVSVIVVLTQSYFSNPESKKFHEQVKDECLPYTKHIIEVVAVECIVDEKLNNKISVKGLEKLSNATVDLLPEGQTKAFIAAQIVDLNAKKLKCQAIIVASAAAAAAIGASPIPFSDAFLLCPVQAAMLCSISAVFHQQFRGKQILKLLKIVAMTNSAWVVGLFITTNLLKFIPGMGSAVAGFIDSFTATVITTVIGEVYTHVLCEEWRNNKGQDLNFDDVLLSFEKKYTQKK